MALGAPRRAPRSGRRGNSDTYWPHGCRTRAVGASPSCGCLARSPEVARICDPDSGELTRCARSRESKATASRVPRGTPERQCECMHSAPSRWARSLLGEKGALQTSVTVAPWFAETQAEYWSSEGLGLAPQASTPPPHFQP